MNKISIFSALIISFFLILTSCSESKLNLSPVQKNNRINAYSGDLEWVSTNIRDGYAKIDYDSRFSISRIKDTSGFSFVRQSNTVDPAYFDIYAILTNMNLLLTRSPEVGTIIKTNSNSLNSIEDCQNVEFGLEESLPIEEDKFYCIKLKERNGFAKMHILFVKKYSWCNPRVSSTCDILYFYDVGFDYVYAFNSNYNYGLIVRYLFLIIGIFILGFAIWKLYRYIKNKSKQKQINITKEKPKIIFFLGLFLILLVLFILLIPTKTVTYEVEVPYETTETYYEKEPYQVQEPYQTQQAYEAAETYYDMIPVTRDVPYQELEYYSETVNQDSCDTIYPSCICKERGWLGLGDCISCVCEKSRPVTKYRTETFQEQITKTRPVTKYRTVTEYRTVTNYRDVEKSRIVMKIRTEPREREINWLFGFRVPYTLHVAYLST